MPTEATSNVGWLLFILRAQRRRERLRLAGGSEGPTASLGDSLFQELRRSVGERLADGRLFPASGSSTVRRGTGRPCNVCGQAIPKHENEHEVEHETGNRRHRTTTFALAHADCYRLWREESRRLQPPQS
jgi:hypothetical protein